MCPPHWRTLNRIAPGLANTLLLYYRPGQERDKNPSAAYVSVANECIRKLAAMEHPEDLPGLERLHAEFDEVLKRRISAAA